MMVIFDSLQSEPAIRAICKCALCTGHGYYPGDGEICELLLGGQTFEAFVCHDCADQWPHLIKTKIINPTGNPPQKREVIR